MWFQHFKEIQQNRRNGEKRQMKPGKKNRKRKSKDKRQNVNNKSLSAAVDFDSFIS